MNKDGTIPEADRGCQDTNDDTLAKINTKISLEKHSTHPGSQSECSTRFQNASWKSSSSSCPTTRNLSWSSWYICNRCSAGKGWPSVGRVEYLPREVSTFAYAWPFATNMMHWACSRFPSYVNLFHPRCSSLGHRVYVVGVCT